MYTIRQGSRICINAPAKLNFFLELRQRRSDGYHEIESLMVPISLYDHLSLSPRTDSRLELSCSWASGLTGDHLGMLPDPTSNLAHKALELLRKRARISVGANVFLLKRIPSQAGMGGASSDAAAALMAGNLAWDLNWSREKLVDVAQELGSDVPFFLFNSLAQCTGRGEIVRRLETNQPISLVVIKPPVGLSTAQVYRHASVPEQPKQSESLVAALNEVNLEGIAFGLFNRLQEVATKLAPCINGIARFFDDTDVSGHQMSGSGTSYFALCRNRWHARQIASRLRATQLGMVFSATTIGLHSAL